VVINVSYLAQSIIQALGDGQRWGLRIQYSPEIEPRETFGGLMHAMHLLSPNNAVAEPFLLVNGDVYCDVDFSSVIEAAKLSLSHQCLGYLVMVDNPEHNTQGDFYLETQREILHRDGDNKLTFSGLSVLTPALLQRFPAASNKLSEVFTAAMQESALCGGHYQGLWRDIGTPERLHELDQLLLSED
jgi:MurNAc alpha-1-phosphate uridylyltransferase